MTLVTQEEAKHTAPTIMITTHDMDKQIEDGPVPWYLFNTVVNLYTGVIIHHKDLM